VFNLIHRQAVYLKSLSALALVSEKEFRTMPQLSIQNIGLSSVILMGMYRRLLVDAFNSMTKSPGVLPGDIILFTHDDNDHFSPDALPDIRGTDSSIIGPPTIVKPLLERERATLDQINVLYSVDNTNPASITLGGMKMHCYHTQHFNNWDPVHNSYLIEHGETRIYITGDSVLSKELADTVGSTDAIICNIVEEGMLRGQTPEHIALHHCLSDLLHLQAISRTKLIVGVHLLEFPQAVDAKKLKALISENGFTGITIPVSTGEVIPVV
jgi:L-ascorbate metabolism protein UlaG (beta-lactamase superfamily)